MKIECLGDHSTRFGVFRAFLDLGICAGPAILGLDADLLNEYVWALAEETGPEPPYDEELERLTCSTSHPATPVIRPPHQTQLDSLHDSSTTT
jgi:hypothetical protein